MMKVPTQKIHANVLVAKDGSGQCKTIMEAVNLVPFNNVKAFVIYIKQGVYAENVVVDKNKTDVIFIGDGLKNWGDGFMAKDIRKHQAVAIRVVSDLATFYNCRFDGYQDTLYAVRSRQFYRHCTITGTIDFIFGDAMAVFQNCKIILKKPLPYQQCIITAQGRQQYDGPGAFIFQNCTITAEPNYYPFKAQNRAFFGPTMEGLLSDYLHTIIH
ncbi:putative pectinesterase/pectinesterase inhibitor 43 [Bienertia sinuspersici]